MFYKTAELDTVLVGRTHFAPVNFRKGSISVVNETTCMRSVSHISLVLGVVDFITHEMIKPFSNRTCPSGFVQQNSKRMPAQSAGIRRSF